MNKIKNVSPFFYAFFLLFSIGLILLLPLDELITATHFSVFQIEYVILFIKMMLIFFIGWGSIKKLSMLALSGLSTTYKWSYKFLNLIPFYLVVLGILGFITNDFSQIKIDNVLLLLGACLIVGFGEEFVFRGSLQPLFIKKYIGRKNGLYLAVFFPALFFGLSHLFNLAVNDNIPQVIGQVIYAIFIGYFFGALLLKTNKLIPIAITHGLINFFFLFGSLPAFMEDKIIGLEETSTPLIDQISGASGPLLIFFPLLLVGLLIVRKLDKEQLLAKITFDADDA